MRVWRLPSAVRLLSAIGLIATLSFNAWSAVSPSASHYVPDVLIGGKQVQRWHDQTRVINVMITPGTNVPGWSPDMVSVVKQAFYEWQQALANKVQFQFVSDPRITDINVIWRERSNGLEIGAQTIRWANNTITQADVELSVYNPESQRFTIQQLKAISLHEIGHALGLRGHSANPNDIMFPSLTPIAKGLSSRDVNTIRALYAMKPSITNPIGTHLMAYRYYMYYLQLGIQANNSQKSTLAMDYFKKASQYYPNDPKINYFLGMGAYNSKQYQKAIDYFTRSVPSLSDQPDLLANAEFFMAQSLMALGIQDMQANRTLEGRKKFAEANTRFSNALKQPSLPANLRQVAITNQQRLRQFG